MDIYPSLFEGQLICLAPIDYDKDPQTEAAWSQDAEYLRLLNTEPARPLSTAQVKKKYEAIEKEAEESKNLFYFTIRKFPAEGQEPGNDLLGFARLYWIEWTHGNAMVQLAIGDRRDWGHGYGTEALQMLMRYAFSELNLFRLAALVPEYNLAALHLFQNTGFVEEVRRREALNRDGRRWDLIHLGLLREEWEVRRQADSPTWAGNRS